MKWICDGTPDYTLEETEKRERGTDIILHIDKESEEFLEESRIEGILQKYCRFLPVPIAFGKKTEWKDGKSVELDEDKIINNTNPLWTRKPADVKEEDYQGFLSGTLPDGGRSAVQHPPECGLSFQPYRNSVFPEDQKQF